LRANPGLIIRASTVPSLVAMRLRTSLRGGEGERGGTGGCEHLTEKCRHTCWHHWEAGVHSTL
jgi:hypothetical protein